MFNIKTSYGSIGLFLCASVAGLSLLSACSETTANNVVDEKVQAAVATDLMKSTWQPVGLNSVDETVNAFVSTKNGRIIAGASSGPYSSKDNGKTWQKIGIPKEHAAAVFSLTSDDKGKLYAGLSKYGVLTSVDNGLKWELQNSGLNQGGPRSSYAMISAGPNILKGTHESGLYLSADAGKTWQPSNRGIPLNMNTSRMVSVTQLVKNDKTVYALTDLGVRYSTDNGKEWNKPYHNGIERLGYMLSLAVKGDTLYTGVGTSSKGVFYSVDHGENWKSLGLEEEEPYVLHISKQGHLFAGTKDGEVYRTKNGGKSWDKLTKGLPASNGVYALFTTKDGALLAGLNRKGIYLLR